MNIFYVLFLLCLIFLATLQAILKCVSFLGIAVSIVLTKEERDTLLMFFMNTYDTTIRYDTIQTPIQNRLLGALYCLDLTATGLQSGERLANSEGGKTNMVAGQQAQSGGFVPKLSYTN